MIEFRFGLFNNKTFDYIDGLSKLFNAFSSGDGLGIGAQFTNVGRAEIYGVDLSTSGCMSLTVILVWHILWGMFIRIRSIWTWIHGTRRRKQMMT